MSEPRARAKSIRPVVPGVYRWHIADERIGGAPSDAFAVVEDDGVVLIDPLPLVPRAEASLARLGRVEAILLTGSCHQRSAWRHRKKFAAKVYAPRLSAGLAGAPDETYDDGDVLPGGLLAVHAPGPTESHFALFRKKGGVLFCPDLLLGLGRKGVRFIAAEYQDDPAATRGSVRKLLALPFRVVCFSHGQPVTSGAKAAFRRALLADALR